MHTKQQTVSSLLDTARFDTLTEGWNWQEYLMQHVQEETEAIRQATSRGRPLASDALITKLETKLNRRLRPLPHGRPRKKP